MLRRISVFLLAVLLVLSLAGNVAMAQTEPDLSDRGQPGADEPKDTGKPDDPNSWGSVAAQLADEGVMGAHSSDPVPPTDTSTGCFGDNREHNCRETPRDGLGNVARNDLGDHGTVSCSDTVTTNCDSGSQLPAHGCVAGAAELPGFDGVQPNCQLDPQEIHEPEPEG